MNRRQVGIILGLVFAAAAIALTVVFREALRQFIAPALVDAWMYARRIGRGLDPEVIWGGLLILTYLLIFRSLPSPESAEQTETSFWQPSAEGRVEFWRKEVKHILRAPKLSAFSVIEIKRLLIDVVSFQRQCTERQAEVWLTSERNAPPEVRELFSPDLARMAPTAAQPGLRQRFWRWLFGESRQELHGTIVNDLDIIIQYLEEQLEAAYDDANS